MDESIYPSASSGTLLVFAVALALNGSACAPLSGTSSLTVLSAETPHGLVPAAKTEQERACTNWALVFFVWGDQSSHETLVSRMLERTGADTLVDAKAESSTWGFPYLYMRSCETVTARPAHHTIARAQ